LLLPNAHYLLTQIDLENDNYPLTLTDLEIVEQHVAVVDEEKPIGELPGDVLPDFWRQLLLVYQSCMQSCSWKEITNQNKTK
jgi:hypothetical protein